MKEPVAAFYLSYSVERFRQKWQDRSTGFPPPRREGRSTFWLKDDLDRWLDRQFQVSSQDDGPDSEFERLLQA
jgi:predicted DNA-binding transcriptional regulator AlpA